MSVKYLNRCFVATMLLLPTSIAFLSLHSNTPIRGPLKFNTGSSFEMTNIDNNSKRDRNCIIATSPSILMRATKLSLLERDITSTKNNKTNIGHGRSDSPLSMICEDRKEFELNLGKAMDTLKKDYPYMLTEAPDFSIFDEDLEVVDPSGVKLHGINNYKKSFSFVRSVVSFFYCPESSGLTFRLVFDWARNNIRVSWNAQLIPKVFYGGEGNKLHVDGISVYEIDRSSGLITQHRVEHLLVNDNPVFAPKGVLHALTNEVTQAIPAGGGYGMSSHNERFVMKFENKRRLYTPKSKLFTLTSSSEPNKNDNFDYEAYRKKNQTRKKYNLPPLSEEEFLEIEDQVRQLEVQQKSRQQEQQAASELAQKKKKKKNDFLARMTGGVLEDSCESNFDCERPMVCCDFLLKKVCCASGMKVLNGVPGQMQPVRIPIPAIPRGGPNGMPENPSGF